MPAPASRRPASVAGGAERKRRAAARELARTPIVDPYRGQLLDPYAGNPRAGNPRAGDPRAGNPRRYNSDAGNTAVFRPANPEPLALPPMPGSLQPGYPMSPRSATPAPAMAAGVLSIILGAFAALSGLSLIAVVALQNSLGEPDRSFYQGRDASTVVLGLLDFALAAAGVLGGATMLGGRLVGRLWLTAFGWAMFGLSWYWIVSHRGTAIVPTIVAATAAAILLFSYHPLVTRWLGVQVTPQPE